MTSKKFLLKNFLEPTISADMIIITIPIIIPTPDQGLIIVFSFTKELLYYFLNLSQTTSKGLARKIEE